MNLLSDSIKCTRCKEIFKLPVSLPCGHCICKHHVNQAVESNANKQIDCFICSETYDIPINGFAPNRPLESLLEKEIDSINLGDKYNSARDKCEQLERMLEHFIRIRNDPEVEISAVIKDLKNMVDLRREEMKEEIDKESLEMIEKLDEFEKECKSNAESMKSDSELDKKLKTWSNDLKQWQQSLNSFKRNANKWKAILIESSSHLKKLQSEVCKFNENLFLKRFNRLNSSNLFLSSPFYTIR